MSLFARWLMLIAAMLSASLAMAQPAASPFESRARQLPDVLFAKVAAEDYFAQAFLAQIPKEQVAEISKQLIATYGPPTGEVRVTAVNGQSGAVEVSHQKAVVMMTLSIEAAPPHRVIGLLVTGAKARDDNVAKLSAEFAALKGRSGLLVQRLDQPRAPPLMAINADQSFAVGSSFKLWLLGEAARAVSAKERKWGDVVPLSQKSLPSGITQKWPARSPMTLHSLATLMISISDNTATDTLLYALGERKVGSTAVRMTGDLSGRKTPVLSTLEAFALKMPANADLREVYVKTRGSVRIALTEAEYKRRIIDGIDVKQLAGNPLYIDQIEWFASPREMARTMDWLRLNAGPEAMGILAINSGIPEGDAARFAYLGYKGGSEVGVIAMNFVVRTKSGAWYAVAGSWNDTTSPVDELRFLALVSRALALIPD